MSNTTNETKPTTEDLMGYENQIEHAPETSLPDTSNAEDVQTVINKAVKEVTVDDNGKYVYPENMDPMLKSAVAATKSYRDNQSGFTKSQQSLKETEAENEALRKQLATFTSKSLELSQADKAELETLKTSNPDEWRRKLNSLETEAKTTIQTKLDETTEEARQKASGDFEIKRRYEYLDTFNENREHPITPEVLDSDIPPRITNKLAEGTVSFEEFLDEVSEYLDSGKVVSSTPDVTTTDLNKANGSSKPSESAKKEQGEIDYSQTTL